jgi:hypothetical protein
LKQRGALQSLRLANRDLELVLASLNDEEILVFEALASDTVMRIWRHGGEHFDVHLADVEGPGDFTNSGVLNDPAVSKGLRALGLLGQDEWPVRVVVTVPGREAVVNMLSFSRFGLTGASVAASLAIRCAHLVGVPDGATIQARVERGIRACQRAPTIADSKGQVRLHATFPKRLNMVVRDADLLVSVLNPLTVLRPRWEPCGVLRLLPAGMDTAEP